ncbi:MAG TPA: hypothetical protein VE569_12800 [Acidimicrobiia bacterium]|nr:hypothetical protein [Acidimicrobiia bacterium]
MNVENLRPSREFADRLLELSRSVPVFLLVFVPLSVIYLATANLSTHNHIDPLTNSLTAWQLGMTGSVVMPERAGAATEDYRGNIAWIVESPKGPVSQYPPGAAALAAPAYWLMGDPMTDWYVEGSNRRDADAILFPLPSAAPATVVAALASAAAMGFLAAAIPYAGSSHTAAVVTGYVAGLGTTMWAVASDALWQHGPGAMWVALGIYLAARSWLVWSGLAFGAAILTRPDLALIAAAVGLYLSFSRRCLRPAMRVGIGSVLGLVVLLWFNWWLWGEPTVTGGYGDVFVERLGEGSLGSYLENIAGALFDPLHGLFSYSPFLLLLIPGLRAGWRKSPDWAKGAGIGAILYLLVQLKVNRFSGGHGFLGYRYPLEALSAAGSMFFLSYANWVRERRLVNMMFWAAVAFSLVPQIWWKLWIVPTKGQEVVVAG